MSKFVGFVVVEREPEGQKISAERRNFALSRKFCVRASNPMHYVSETSGFLSHWELILYTVILPDSPPNI